VLLVAVLDVLPVAVVDAAEHVAVVVEVAAKAIVEENVMAHVQVHAVMDAQEVAREVRYIRIINQFINVSTC